MKPPLWALEQRMAYATASPETGRPFSDGPFVVKNGFNKCVPKVRLRFQYSPRLAREKIGYGEFKDEALVARVKRRARGVSAVWAFPLAALPEALDFPRSPGPSAVAF